MTPEEIASKAKYGDRIRVIRSNPNTPNVAKEFVFQGVGDSWGGKGFLTSVSETSDGCIIPFSWIIKAKILDHSAKPRRGLDK